MDTIWGPALPLRRSQREARDGVLTYLPDAYDLYADSEGKSPSLLPIHSADVYFASVSIWPSSARGRLIGDVQARAAPKQTLPAGVFEIGVILYRQQDRGHTYGREAVELLTGWLVETAGGERVQAGTDKGNAAMRSVLEHLGFRLEGVMRAPGPMSDGTRRDGAMYAVIKSDWIAGRRGPT